METKTEALETQNQNLKAHISQKDQYIEKILAQLEALKTTVELQAQNINMYKKAEDFKVQNPQKFSTIQPFTSNIPEFDSEPGRKNSSGGQQIIPSPKPRVSQVQGKNTIMDFHGRAGVKTKDDGGIDWF